MYLCIATNTEWIALCTVTVYHTRGSGASPCHGGPFVACANCNVLRIIISFALYTAVDVGIAQACPNNNACVRKTCVHVYPSVL